MTPSRSIVEFSLDHPRLVTGLMIALTLALGALIPMVKGVQYYLEWLQDYGDYKTFFGQFEENTNVYTGVRYSF